MNIVILSGNLGKDPEIGKSKTKKYVRFRLAVNRNGGSNDPLWLTVVAFDELADAVAEKLKKGQKVAIKGRLEQDKQGRFGIVAHEIEFFPPASGQAKRNGKTKNKTDQAIGEVMLPPEEEELMIE